MPDDRCVATPASKEGGQARPLWLRADRGASPVNVPPPHYCSHAHSLACASKRRNLGKAQRGHTTSTEKPT